MVWILVIIGVVFIVGLLARNKGDGFLDTMGEGCSLTTGCILWIIVIVVAIIVIAALASK